MKLKKLMLVIIGVSVLALAGCGDSGDSSKGEEKKEETSENADEKEADKEDDSDSDNGDAGWSKDDFSVYDSSGKVIDYPTNTTISLESSSDGQTSKGVAIGDKVKVALADYDFTGFYYAMSKYPKLGSKTDQEKEKEENFFADYPELTDAIANNEELGKYGLGLYISGYFYEKDGKLEKMDQLETGAADKDSVEAPYEMYKITFYTSKGEIIKIDLNHSTVEVE